MAIVSPEDQVGVVDDEHMLFKDYLMRLQQVCATWQRAAAKLPQPSLQSNGPSERHIDSEWLGGGDPVLVPTCLWCRPAVTMT